MTGAFDSLLPAHSRCEIAVAIPARNEERLIADTLAALVAQRDHDGSLAPERFEILVFANGCSDGTAAVVRDVAAQHPGHAIHVVQASLPKECAHVGGARRAVMNAAAARFIDRGRDGIIASTDADTRPDPCWLANTIEEMRSADVVLGRILVDAAAWNALPAHVRRMIREEETYLLTLAHLESLADPERYGSWPRHYQRFGASFAVRARTYRAAGGVPLVTTLEDVALYETLVRRGARVRHSFRVRVKTSARRDARVSSGFANHLALFDARGVNGVLMVEHPETTLARIARGLVLARDPVPITEATRSLRQVLASPASVSRATRIAVESAAG